MWERIIYECLQINSGFIQINLRKLNKTLTIVWLSKVHSQHQIDWFQIQAFHNFFTFIRPSINLLSLAQNLTELGTFSGLFWYTQSILLLFRKSSSLLCKMWNKYQYEISWNSSETWNSCTDLSINIPLLNSRFPPHKSCQNEYNKEQRTPSKIINSHQDSSILPLSPFFRRQFRKDARTDDLFVRVHYPGYMRSHSGFPREELKDPRSL